MGDFTLKQTQNFEDKYNSKTLIGNWFEERCDPNSQNSYFFKQKQAEFTGQYTNSLSPEQFYQANKNWMQQLKPVENAFVSVTQQEFTNPKTQKRLSDVDPFMTRPGHFDKNPQELEKYRKEWTKSQMCFKRSYAGAENKEAIS